MDTISSIGAENFLSFQKLDLKLGAFNALVGPNGAGKSNLLQIFQFLGDVARFDLIDALKQFGGYESLRFRGSGAKSGPVRLSLTGKITKYASEAAPDEYRLSFWPRFYMAIGDQKAAQRRVIHRNERIVLKRTAGRGRRITLSGNTLKIDNVGDTDQNTAGQLEIRGSATGLATLRRLGELYEASQVEELAQIFLQLRLFEINVDKARLPSETMYSERLSADGSNLASFLYWLRDKHPAVFSRLCSDMSQILPSFESFEFAEIGGADSAVRIDLREKGLSGFTPMARASYGTIRALALLAMLHDPNPPRLTCLEEVDHGLHPHALDLIVDRLREASSRTQIVLATHSPALVNRLKVEELIVAERDLTTGGTRIFRPSGSVVRRLSDETGYGLGELWFSGVLGGAL